MRFEQKKNFKEKVDPNTYNKLLVAIFKIQSELIRSYSLSIDPNIIVFEEDKLVWNIIGHGANWSQANKFKDSDLVYKIRDFSINELRNSRILHGSELSQLNFERSKRSPSCILISKREAVSRKLTFWEKLLSPFRKALNYIMGIFSV